jgi:hypothetical protein
LKQVERLEQDRPDASQLVCYLSHAILEFGATISKVCRSHGLYWHWRKPIAGAIKALKEGHHVSDSCGCSGRFVDWRIYPDARLEFVHPFAAAVRDYLGNYALCDWPAGGVVCRLRFADGKTAGYPGDIRLFA